MSALITKKKVRHACRYDIELPHSEVVQNLIQSHETLRFATQRGCRLRRLHDILYTVVSCPDIGVWL